MKKTITKIDDCYIGSSIERSEDDTLISGKGQFGDDIGHPPGTLHVAVLRSSYASGKIVNIDTSGALAIPGVHSIIDETCLLKFPNHCYLFFVLILRYGLVLLNLFDTLANQ